MRVSACEVYSKSKMAEKRPSMSEREAVPSRKVDSGYVQTVDPDSDAVGPSGNGEGDRTKRPLPTPYLQHSQADGSPQQPFRIATTIPIQESGFDQRLVRRPACSNSECSTTFDILQKENEELRRQLEAASARNAVLQQENIELRRTVESMKQRITCSEIVEGHSHLKETCTELQEELQTMNKLNRNAEVADQNKAEKIQIFSDRLTAVKSKLKNRESYIELLHDQLAQVFVKLEIEKHDAQRLNQVKEQLERELHSAQAENQAYLEELWEHLAQIREMKDLMYVLRGELEQEREIRRDIVRRTSSKSKDRPLSVPVFPQRRLSDSESNN